jgi:hypothetical protein
MITFVIREDVYQKIAKSLGIRDMSKLIPKKVPVRSKNGYYIKTVYVRPELIDNPYKHKLDDFPEAYREDLPKLLDELQNFDFNKKNEIEVFEMVRKMGKANHMAIKGNHLRLNDEEKKVNDKIYSVKRDFCENLAEYYVNNKLNCKWLKLEQEKNYNSNVLYVRDSKTGIQISFHGYNNEKGVDIDITKDPNIWDGIVNAFEYSEDEYKEAKKQKEITERFKRDFVNYASNFYEKILSDTVQKALKSKRVDNMLQEDFKDKALQSKDDLQVEIRLSMPDQYYNDVDLYVDDFMNYINKAKINIKLSSKTSSRYLRGGESIKKMILVALEKQSLSPIKVFNDNFEEMEKGFLLEEDY